MAEMFVPRFFGPNVVTTVGFVFLHGKFNTEDYEDQMKICQICIVHC